MYVLICVNNLFFAEDVDLLMQKTQWHHTTPSLWFKLKDYTISNVLFNYEQTLNKHNKLQHGFTGAECQDSFAT